jgi:predicted RNA binding protein YcfA (HicA-like mRNA interferase family)
VKDRDLLKLLHDDGWQHIRTTGSHLHHKHPTKLGVVIVPGGGKLAHDVAPGTLRSISARRG